MDRRTFSLIAAALLASACDKQAPVVIDGATQESFEKTSDMARRELPNADRLIYDRALHTVGGRRLAERDAQALARVTFDGMTAQQVVADQRSREP